MEKKLFTIGEVSDIKRITKKALRFYERIGLLRPHRIDPANGYRYYSWEQFTAIDVIKAMRVLDVSPIEIAALMEERDTEKLLESLETVKAGAARKARELEKTMETIDGLRESIISSRTAAANRGVYRRTIEDRLALSLPFEGISDAGDAALAYAAFDGLILRFGLVNAYGTGILLEDGGKGYAPARIFNTVRQREGSDASAASALPGGEYVCVTYTEKDAARRGAELSRYCAKNGIRPALVLQADLLNDVFSLEPPAVELQILASEGKRPRKKARAFTSG